LGLLAYPVLIEPNVTLRQQSLGWSAGYIAFVVLGIIAAAASGSGGDPEEASGDTPSTAPASDEPTTKSEKSEKTEPTKETEATEPQQPEGTLPIEDGDWRLDSVSLKDDGLGDFGGISRITYIGQDNNASNIFTVTVLAKDGSVVASLQGSAEGMGPNGTETVQLISSDKWEPGNYKLFDFQKGL
jgi:hypothetical protein